MSQKLCSCKACGQQIAKSAKSCPHCGAKNKKKNPLLGLLLVIAIVFLISNMLNKKEKPKDVTLQTWPKQEVQAVVSTPEKEDVPEDTEETEKIEETEPTENVETEAVPSSGLRPEFKAAMDSYEKFFEDYCDFMKKYQKNPSDLSLLADYAKFMKQYTETMSDLAAWEEADMNDEELKYYVDVNARITKMLIDVAG